MRQKSDDAVEEQVFGGNHLVETAFAAVHRAGRTFRDLNRSARQTSGLLNITRPAPMLLADGGARAPPQRTIRRNGIPMGIPFSEAIAGRPLVPATSTATPPAVMLSPRELNAPFDQQHVLTALGAHLSTTLAGQLWHEAARQIGVEHPVTNWEDARRVAGHIEQMAEGIKSEVARPLRVAAIMQKAFAVDPGQKF